jgi:transcriptional regulator with XRE-family HTH domain
MTRLGSYLKQLREQKDRSRHWVERQSRLLYPEEKERQISHSYLRQIEEGMRERPNPLKLQTLAEAYGVDYRRILGAAGYLTDEFTSLGPDTLQEGKRGGQEADLALAHRLIDWLENRGLHSGYFMNSIMRLSDESLHLVNRLITTLSVQESQIKEKPEERSIRDDG